MGRKKENELVKAFKQARKEVMIARKKRVEAEMLLINSKIEWISEDGRLK